MESWRPQHRVRLNCRAWWVRCCLFRKPGKYNFNDSRISPLPLKRHWFPCDNLFLTENRALWTLSYLKIIFFLKSPPLIWKDVGEKISATENTTRKILGEMLLKSCFDSSRHPYTAQQMAKHCNSPNFPLSKLGQELEGCELRFPIPAPKPATPLLSSPPALRCPSPSRARRPPRAASGQTAFKTTACSLSSFALNPNFKWAAAREERSRVQLLQGQTLLQCVGQSKMTHPISPASVWAPARKMTGGKASKLFLKNVLSIFWILFSISGSWLRSFPLYPQREIRNPWGKPSLPINGSKPSPAGDLPGQADYSNQHHQICIFIDCNWGISTNAIMQIPGLWVAGARAQLTHPYQNKRTAPRRQRRGKHSQGAGIAEQQKRLRNSSVTNCAQPWTPAAQPPPSPLNIRYIWAHIALLGPWRVRGQNYCLQQEKGHRSISIKLHPFMCYPWAKQPMSWFLSYFFFLTLFHLLISRIGPEEVYFIWRIILHQLLLWTCASRSAKVMEKWVVQLAHLKVIGNYRIFFFFLL